MILSGIRLDKPLSFGFGVEVWLAFMGDHRVILRRWFGPALMPGSGIVPDSSVLYGLNHPRLQRLLWEGPDPDGSLVQISDWVDGQSLDRVPGRVDGGDMPLMAADGLSALKYLHLECPGAPLVHGDISPANLVAGLVDGHPTLTLIDLRGLRSGDRACADDGIILGTLHYMPDEVLDGGPLTPAADVWSLAMSLAVAGGATFPWMGGSTPNEVLEMRRGWAPDGLPGLDPSIDRDLRSLLADMLSVSPGRRPTAAGALERVSTLQTERV